MSCSCQIDAVAGREACRRWFATRPATTVIRWRLLRAIALSAVLALQRWLRGLRTTRTAPGCRTRRRLSREHVENAGADPVRLEARRGCVCVGRGGEHPSDDQRRQQLLRQSAKPFRNQFPPVRPGAVLRDFPGDRNLAL